MKPPSKMRWISASKACQTNRTRNFVLAESGSSRSEAKYATARMATVENKERIVVWSINEAKSLDGVVPGICTISADCVVYGVANAVFSV